MNLMSLTLIYRGGRPTNASAEELAALLHACLSLPEAAQDRLARMVADDQASVSYPARSDVPVIWIDQPARPDLDMRMTPAQFESWCQAHPEGRSA